MRKSILITLLLASTLIKAGAQALSPSDFADLFSGRGNATLARKGFELVRPAFATDDTTVKSVEEFGGYSKKGGGEIQAKKTVYQDGSILITADYYLPNKAAFKAFIAKLPQAGYKKNGSPDEYIRQSGTYLSAGFALTDDPMYHDKPAWLAQYEWKSGKELSAPGN